MKIGIYQSYWGAVGGGQRYVGVVAEILARQHKVEIVHHARDFDRAKVEEALEMDLSAVAFRFLPRPERPAWPTRNPWARLRCERDWCREISSAYDVFIDSSDTPPYFCHAGKGVLLIHFPLIGFEEFHGHTTDGWGRRWAPARWLRGLFHRIEWKQRLASYDLCLVNSEFTRRWIKRLWGLRASVVYPPMREGFRPKPKEQLVLSIGAFHYFQHKKHDVLVETFKGLCDAGLRQWRYVLAGAGGSTAEDKAYVERLRAASRDYPIEIRIDLSGAELKDLLERASLLWHSMGYGVDAEKEPQRMEHFGMVATEAMAAGCVPVVFNGGGLPEIVAHGRNGFLWNTLEELKTHTLALVGDDALSGRMRSAALHRATAFAMPAFRARLADALAPVLA